MKQVILAAVAGGLVLFAWNMFSYMALPWHLNAVNELEMSDEALQPVFSVLNQKGSGVYHHPGMGDGGDPTAVAERYEQGPVITMLVYRQEGMSPFPPENLLMGLIVKLLAAAIVACLLSLAVDRLHSYSKRVAFVALFGVVGLLAVQVEPALWWRHGLAFVGPNMADQVIGWSLAGLVIAALVKPNQEGQKPTA